MTVIQYRHNPIVFTGKGVGKMKGKKSRISMTKRQELEGLFFAVPFIIGTLAFFAYPLIFSVLLSFGDLDKGGNGLKILFSGLGNYKRIFVIDTSFLPGLWSICKVAFLKVPLILIISLLFAIMLNRAGRLKSFYRIAVFIPFLIGMGQVLDAMLDLGFSNQILAIKDNAYVPRELLEYMGDDILGFLDYVFNMIVMVLWSCSVQTLLFLSSIQSISPSLYESSQIDGANAYENFWKITLPMVSPMLMLNAVYTVIICFTGRNNSVLKYILNYTLVKAEYGFSSALGCVYMITVFIFIGIAWLLISSYLRKNRS